MFVYILDLTSVLTRLHETMISLASQLSVTHNAVQGLKDKYRAYRRNILCDDRDIFTDGSLPVETRIPVPVTIGPSPFSSK